MGPAIEVSCTPLYFEARNKETGYLICDCHTVKKPSSLKSIGKDYPKVITSFP